MRRPTVWPRGAAAALWASDPATAAAAHLEEAKMKNKQ